MSEQTDALLARIEQLEVRVVALSRESMETYVEAVVRRVLNSEITLESSSLSMSLLREWLAAIVPLHIVELRQRGGPTPSEFAEALALGDDFAEQGDILLYFHSAEISAKEKEKGRKLRTRLARALAVAAFLPGGVQWNGLDFCEHPDRWTSLEQQKAEREGWYQAAYDAVRAELEQQFGEDRSLLTSRPRLARRPLINDPGRGDPSSRVARGRVRTPKEPT